MLGQANDPVGHKDRSGLVARDHDLVAHAQDLVFVEALAVDFGADNRIDEIFAGCLAPLCDKSGQILEDLGERVLLFLLGHLDADRRVALLELLGPQPELPPLIARHTQQLADDRGRQRVGEVMHELAPTRIDEPVDQLVGEPAHAGLEIRHPAHRERPRHDAAQAVVPRRVHVEDAEVHERLRHELGRFGRLGGIVRRIAGEGLVVVHRVPHVGESGERPEPEVGVVIHGMPVA